jgi:hypothetical protein
MRVAGPKLGHLKLALYAVVCFQLTDEKYILSSI